jgi:hypothetical protein
MADIINIIEKTISNHDDPKNMIITSLLGKESGKSLSMYLIVGQKNFVIDVFLKDKVAEVAIASYIEEARNPFMIDIFHEYNIPMPDKDIDKAAIIDDIVSRFINAESIIQSIIDDYGVGNRSQAQ